MRRALAWRYVLRGASLGFGVALLVSVAAWKGRRADLRADAPWLGLVGTLGGMAIAHRRRWSDSEVASFLDARLLSHEAIVSALEIGAAPATGDGALSRLVESEASEALLQAAPRRIAVRVVRPYHALGVVALMGLAIVSRVSLPPLPATARSSPSSTRLPPAETSGLEKASGLAQIDPRDNAQRERLNAIARDTEALREQLRAGLETREALDRLARLDEALGRERLSLGDGSERAGLEGAIARLEATDVTRPAARALADHDLQGLDAEMQKLANAREKRDRTLAHQAFEEAAGTSAQDGSPAVARALEDEKHLLDSRGARADTLRTLASLLKAAGASDQGAERALESLDRERSDDAARALARALDEAVGRLTAAEQQALARKMSEAGGLAAAQNGGAWELGQPPVPSVKELKEKLRAMANETAESREAEREGAIAEARVELAGIARKVSGAANGNGNGNGNVGSGQRRGEPGVVQEQTMASRARAAINAGGATSPEGTTYGAGAAGATTLTPATGDLRAAAPAQLDGIEKSDVPEEYRLQVKQYFTSKESPR